MTKTAEENGREVDFLVEDDVDVALYTYDAGANGITENDLIFAARLEQVAIADVLAKVRKFWA